MLHWYPVKELMHKLTGLNVEKGAVFELTNHFEDQIEKVIIQSKKELEKLNDLKEIQGLYQKSRIDRDCVRNAIKIINTDEHVIPSYETGGIIKKKKKKFEKHPQKENVFSEVA
jgi:hypothetical protein